VPAQPNPIEARCLIATGRPGDWTELRCLLHAAAVCSSPEVCIAIQYPPITIVLDTRAAGELVAQLTLAVADSFRDLT
jgi:hypothetical protein